jgi:hypothetical protein
MIQALIENLPWVAGLLGLFSFLAVHSWSSERRREREALYRSEAIKKIAEMGADTPEPVLALLRESMRSWKDQPNPWTMGPLQAREYYRSQTLQKIAEATGGGGEAALRFLREEQGIHGRRTREGLQLGGAICVAVGVALAGVLRALVPLEPVYLTGLIPGTVGAVLLLWSLCVDRKRGA